MGTTDLEGTKYVIKYHTEFATKKCGHQYDSYCIAGYLIYWRGAASETTMRNPTNQNNSKQKTQNKSKQKTQWRSKVGALGSGGTLLIKMKF